MNSQELEADKLEAMRERTERSEGSSAARCSDAPLPAKEKTSGQCECCASPFGDLVQLQGTKRIICPRCLGFMARWLIELEEHQNEKLSGRGPLSDDETKGDTRASLK